MPYLIRTGKVTQNNVPTPMYILARLNLDSQCISVAQEYAELKLGARQRRRFKAALAKKKAGGQAVKAAMTFPGGTHDLWIRYWLAAGGIDPDKDIETIVVPPAQMVANMKVGTMDCFCVGEPWNEQLKNQKIGYTAVNTGELWNKHPEKSFAHARRLGRQAPQGDQGAADGGAGSADVVRRSWRTATSSREIVSKRALDQRARCADIADRAEGQVRLRHRQGRREQPAHHEVLARPRVLPVPEPRPLVPHRERPLGQVHRQRGLQGADRARSTARTCGARRRRSSASPPTRFRPRPRAASRRSSTARCSIPANPAAYLASLAIKRVS